MKQIHSECNANGTGAGAKPADSWPENVENVTPPSGATCSWVTLYGPRMAGYTIRELVEDVKTTRVLFNTTAAKRKTCGLLKGPSVA